ncbi:Arm DNA-binding domain-containing protein [Pontibacter toksunensis]|uniref:Arm DNA-binding domain-containing protein n=1 Tax=Pontibacter toksunensis TaxID=1332631 RepID=A0ABW6BTJ6_9BACT
MIPVLTSVMLDTRRALKGGCFPVRLRLTYLRQRKYYNTNYALSEADFSKVHAEKPKKKYKELQIAFQEIEQEAIGIIRNLESFSFEEFERKFLKVPAKGDMFSAFDLQIQKLNSEGRVGTAHCYASASFSLLSFVCKTPLAKKKGLSIAKSLEKKENLLKKENRCHMLPSQLIFSPITKDGFWIMATPPQRSVFIYGLSALFLTMP